jgi:transposase
VAVIAAMDVEGRIIATVLREKSIKLDALIELSREIKRFYGHRKVTIFLDNLPMHYNPEFKKTAFNRG